MSSVDGAVQAAVPNETLSREQSHAPSSHQIDTAPNTAPESMEVSPAPDAVPTLESLQSQPMTATASSSSQNPPPDLGDGNNAVPYGTRSRNRTGGIRPNYAEDKELDLEIEAAGRYSKSTSKKTTSAVVSTLANENTSVQSEFASVNASNSSSEKASGSVSASPHVASQATSKKRKQPGSNTTVGTNATSTMSVTRTRPTTTNSSRSYVETNMMSFERCNARLNAKKQLVADDGTVLAHNDHAYFVCEPPGEPYYLARIMEFLHKGNDQNGPIDAVRVNWYYRPKDILRRVQDTRVVFASMHSDTCPLTSIRGKCIIQHLSEIESLDEYRVQKDSFWFDKLYDRYMHRYYEVVPTSRVVNVPQHVKAVLDERWKFVLIEIGRGRDLTSASKKCKRCEQFAANHDSVDCAVCKNTYHMRCVKPPLLKKPARGFAWACAACSRAQELKLEARNTPTASDSAQAGEDDLMEEDEDDLAKDQDTRESSVAPEPHPPPTAAQLAQAQLWPYRYLGVHSRVEDALDYDDRIYPRASSRLGPRHQANVNVWHGRPVQLVKPSEIKKRYMKNNTGKKDLKSSKDVSSAAEDEKDQKLKRPKWVVDEPIGYVHRGEDEPVEIKGKKDFTAQLTFKMPDASLLSERGSDEVSPPVLSEETLDGYMKRVKQLATQYSVDECSVDLLTKGIEKLQENNYDVEKALTAMQALHLRSDLKQPDLNREEIKRFEEGVAKYGSELHAVARHIGSNFKESRVVRFYYMWKKTERGKQIWGSYEGRRSKKESKRIDKEGGNSKLVDDVADDHDDSAFDSEKAAQKKKGFECKFCSTRSSRQWRRAPATAPGTLVPRDPAAKTTKDKTGWLTLALCGRCAYLWRRYAIQYESIEEVSKKIAAAGGRAAKRRIDEELMRTIFEAQHESGDLITTQVANEVNKAGMEVPQSIVQHEEPPKKKTKGDKDTARTTPEVIPEKKKTTAAEKPVEAPLDPEPPRVKLHPCAICNVIDPPDQELLKCRDCRLHVHGSCYGVGPKTDTKPWFCDMCRNDQHLQVSTTYECVLCPVKYTPQELMEPPRVTHKKKNDREREKERLEREMLQEAGRRWRQEQEAAGRPVNPREALKRTAWNNWVHVTCAIWTKEIKFGNAELLDEAEGVGFIPHERYEPPCKICKEKGMPTVKCHISTCTSTFHVGCAHQAGYLFGFDVALVKGSRRDSVNVMKLDQETGVVTAAIWCPAHTPVPYVHNMLELTESGLTALQLFARTYKQADTTITGTVRRAAQFMANIPITAPAVQPVQRRVSIINGTIGNSSPAEKLPGRGIRSSPEPSSPRSTIENGDGEAYEHGARQGESPRNSQEHKKCCSCLVEVSPKWWPVQRNAHTGGFARTNASPSINSTPYNTAPPLRESALGNSIVKTEPTEYGVIRGLADVKDNAMYQCHKCHVLKRTPPSSPSQMKNRDRHRTDMAQQPSGYQASYQPPPPPPPQYYPLGRPQPDGPTHTHPLANPVVGHHPSWQSGPAHWNTAPIMRNGNHGPPPAPASAMYGPPPYRPPAPEYGSPYPPRPHGSYSTVPPPSNGVPQHSPPPPTYGQPVHQQQHPPQPPLPPARPASPPRYAPDRSHVPSPRSSITSSILSRPFVPEQPRQGNMESPVNGYGPPPPTSVLMYNQGPPPMRTTSSSAQSTPQIAQEQTQHTHSRQASIDGTPKPIHSAISYVRMPESPGRRPITPSDGVRDESKNGPGASASPSLKNLLS